MFELKNKNVWVPGAQGLLGSAVVRRLSEAECNVIATTRAELNLRDPSKVKTFVGDLKPDAIVLCAAKVGGIAANIKSPVDFIIENVEISNTVMCAAHEANVQRMILFGSSCMYPKNSNTVLTEDLLFQGYIEETNAGYAMAKYLSLELVRAYRKQHNRSYIYAIPTNLFGPNDNFRDDTGHVIAGMFNRFYHAKSIGVDATPIWGTGHATREFMYVDDAADAILHLLKHYDSPEPINIAGTETFSINEIARKVAKIIGYQGPIYNDLSKPDGMMHKTLDSKKIKELGWRPKTKIDDGLQKTYIYYQNYIRSKLRIWEIIEELDLA